MNPLASIDRVLDKITMYRLVLYYLVGLLVAAFIFGFFGLMPIDPTALAFSTAILVSVSLIVNGIFARVFKAETNIESAYITALILTLIISPVTATDSLGVGALIFAAAWAMASKYLFAIDKKHIFNPAAFAVVLLAFLLNHPATWWVGGNLWLLPFVLVGGLLLVRKLRRFDLVLSFAVVALITVAATSSGSAAAVGQSISETLLHSSFFFLAFVMLTEPLTSPPTGPLRVVYGAIVGFLVAPNVHLGSLYLSPELALLVGNVFSYIVSPKGRHMLSLARIEEIAEHTREFVFTPDQPFNYRPGQYLEWTLSHRYADNRGNRRFFTIASSPTDPEVRLAVKFYEPASTFKRKLATLTPGSVISAAHLAGGFVLPKNPKKKLVFIAGGIGVTPFRSMIQYLLDTKEPRTITLLYANRAASDVAYREIFDRAASELGIKVVYALATDENPPSGMIHASIDAALIKREVPDYRERMFYISGPHGMVEAFRKTLAEMGVPRWNIKTDFFPGLT